MESRVITTLTQIGKAKAGGGTKKPNAEMSQAKNLLTAIDRDLLPIFQGTYGDTEPTYESIEKMGKGFTSVIKGIDEKFLPVLKIDNYEIEKYSHQFIKEYESFNKSLDPRPKNKLVSDAQNTEYIKMMKHA